MELEQIAVEAGVHGAVTGVLAAESATGVRTFLVAFGEDEAREWLVLDADGRPLDERARVREVAGLVAMCEIAAELTGQEDEARVASPVYLDTFGTAELGSATGIVEAFVGEVERRYKLPLR